MYGAIIGDLAGSIYEYEQTKKIQKQRIEQLISKDAFYSDDTILTIAIADAIVNNLDYEKSLRKYIMEYRNYRPNFKPYFNSSFSPNLMRWIMGNSIGNGAMMRISPVGYLFNSEDEVRENARLATIPTHNSEEAIWCATTVALIIFYLRRGMSLDYIQKKMNLSIDYYPFKKFNTTCYETIGNCLYVLYNSISFEHAIKKIIYIGGDTDTNAAIVGSMAEALYGVPGYLKLMADEKLPLEFQKVLRKVYVEK